MDKSFTPATATATNTNTNVNMLNQKKRKRKNQNPESNLRFNLDTCLKNKDFTGAIALFDSAISQEDVRLSNHVYNSLLYICSAPETLTSHKPLAVEYGFRIFDRMLSDKIPPTEATITGMSRLAAVKSDPDYAFKLVMDMKEKYGIAPRLRTYGPALHCYCENSMAEKAYAVEEHMKKNGVKLEEAEIAALIKVSVETERGGRVYEYILRLRETVRCVGEETAGVIDRWFRSAKASSLDGEQIDLWRLKEEIERKGGGWHGMGWLGKGKWEVKRARVHENGACCGCGEKLVCVDIDSGETEKFAQSVASLAMERESKSNFKTFMDWIDNHSDFEAIVDGANIALFKQNFAEGGFSIPQLESVVKELYSRNQKWPLVVVHNKRLRRLPGDPSSRQFIDDLTAHGVLYATPNGSNDDWYWLYAAVRLKCLLVTNDEMRDHIFELLGSSFFLQWKERHQVHYSITKGTTIELQMPPAYSVIIQESEKGSWHIPICHENSKESFRSWLCISRECNNII